MLLDNKKISPKDIKKAKRKHLKDLEYIDSRSATILLCSKKAPRVLIWLSFLFFVVAFFWLYNSKIEQLIRGEGEVVPSKKIQSIQNLEGGIISKIFVVEGDRVKKGDILIKIDDKNFASINDENRLKIYELKAKIKRFKAEMNFEDFKIEDIKDTILKKKLEQELKLFEINKILLNQTISILKDKIVQKELNIAQLEQKKEFLSEKLKLINSEVNMKSELLKDKVGSREELILVKQKLVNAKENLSDIKFSIPKLKASILQIKKEIQNENIKYKNRAIEGLNSARDKLARLNESAKIRQDKLDRTVVRSPVNGIIKRVLVNTQGGVIKPGESIVEIVPSNDNLIINTKIKPSDIAFIYPNQDVIVRFSAYDFAIYGSLKAKVINISADTIRDEIDRKNYYLVQVKTYKNYLEKENEKLQIIPGMIATVDIIGRKKRILDYILKPILRAKKNFLSNR